MSSHRPETHITCLQAEGLVQKDPLTRKEALAILEELYELVMQLEKLAREQPPTEEEEVYGDWYVSRNLCINRSQSLTCRENRVAELRQELWLGLRVTVPLGTRFGVLTTYVSKQCSSFTKAFRILSFH
jgi:hypothetical protein